MDQAVLSCAKQQNKRQWPDTDAQKVPPEHEGELCYCAGDHTQEQSDQRRCEGSLIGDNLEPSGCNPVT